MARMAPLLLVCLLAGTSAAKKKRSTKDWSEAVKNIEKEEMEEWEAERKEKVCHSRTCRVSAFLESALNSLAVCRRKSA